MAKREADPRGGRLSGSLERLGFFVLVAKAKPKPRHTARPAAVLRRSTLGLGIASFIPFADAERQACGKGREKRKRNEA